MIDLHAHILPGLDDGAAQFDESFAMLDAARDIGITVIIATPHYNSRYASCREAEITYTQLVPYAEANGIRLILGYELNIRKMPSISSLESFCFTLPNRWEKLLLLELDEGTAFEEASFMISGLVRDGILPVVAHPERYAFVQKNPETAGQLRSLGARIQVDAEALLMSRFSKERRAAESLFKESCVDALASDAHTAEHYVQLGRVLATRKMGNTILPGFF